MDNITKIMDFHTKESGGKQSSQLRQTVEVINSCPVVRITIYLFSDAFGSVHLRPIGAAGGITQGSGGVDDDGGNYHTKQFFCFLTSVFLTASEMRVILDYVLIVFLNPVNGDGKCWNNRSMNNLIGKV